MEKIFLLKFNKTRSTLLETGKMNIIIKFTLTSILCTILLENKSDGKFNKIKCLWRKVTDCLEFRATSNGLGEEQWGGGG